MTTHPPGSIRIAIIGLGGIARIAHLPALAEHPDAQVVAVCDRDESALVRFDAIPAFRSVDDLLGTIEIDVAYVLTPEHLHFDIVRTLLEKNVAVFCEKPLAPSVAETQILADLAAVRNVPLMVGFNRRFAPAYIEARESLRQRPASVGIFEKTRPELGFRGSAENLVHMVDLARFFFGECTDVSAFAQFNDPFWEESLSAILRFESGQVATIVGNRSCGVWTERVDFHGNGQTTSVLAPDELRVAVDGIESVSRQSPIYSGFARPIDTLGFAAQARHFLDCLGIGQPTENDAMSALRTHQLMDQILVSAGLPTEDSRTVSPLAL